MPKVPKFHIWKSRSFRGSNKNKILFFNKIK
jgi:hypothetical protein